MANALYQPIQAAVTNAAAMIQEQWRRFFDDVVTNVNTLTTKTNVVLGVNRFLLAAQPALGAGDAGYVGFVTDYGHLVIWDGAAWQPMDGDYPGYFRDFAVAPGTGWQLADGTAGITYLVFGGPTLTTGSLTVPNLSGTPSYRKSGAAYTGAVNAASGTTGTGTTGTGTTGTGSATVSGTSGSTAATINTTTTVCKAGVLGVDPAVLTGASDPGHTHGAGSYSAAVPGLSVPGLSVPALAVGSIDMANLVTLPYFRR